MTWNTLGASFAVLAAALVIAGCGDDETTAAHTSIDGTLDGGALSFESAAYGVSLHQATPILRSIEVRVSADACTDNGLPPIPMLTLRLSPEVSGDLEVTGIILNSFEVEAQPIAGTGTLHLEQATVRGVPTEYETAPFTGVSGVLAGTLHLDLRTFDINTPGGVGDLRGTLDGAFHAEHCLGLDETHFE